MERQQKPDLSTSSGCNAVNLLALPDNCLHRIVRLMDKKSREQFFMVSKGCQDKPGCAMLVLKACKTGCSYGRTKKGNAEDVCSTIVLYWAAQRSTIELIWCGGRDLLTALQPQQGMNTSPGIYPGVTSLEWKASRSQCLIPAQVAVAFPNLKQLKMTEWAPDPHKPPCPTLTHSLSSLEQLHIKQPGCAASHIGTLLHISHQLSHLPALTSLHVHSTVLAILPASVLGRLTRLELTDVPPDQLSLKDAFKACLRLQSLSGIVEEWLPCLPASAPLTTLTLPFMDLTDTQVKTLLQLPHQLTSIRFATMTPLENDYSSAPCTWRRLCISSACTSAVARLPLHTLDSPISTTCFRLEASADHAADMAAIRAAQPHLIRCGGIRLVGPEVLIDLRSSPAITKQQAEELLEAWAPCLSPPPRRVDGYNPATQSLLQECVTRLWPAAAWPNTNH